MRARFFALFFLAVGCSDKTTAEPGPTDDATADSDPADVATDTPTDTAPVDVCATLKLDKRPFDGGKGGTLRHDLAADFTVTHVDGTTWSLAKDWSGCESYLFIPDTLKKSAKDAASIWDRDLDKLVATSPLGVHYFFFSRTAPDAAADASTAKMAEKVTALLATLPEDKAAHWAKHLHVIKGRPSKFGSWLDTVGGAASATRASRSIASSGSAAWVRSPTSRATRPRSPTRACGPGRPTSRTRPTRRACSTSEAVREKKLEADKATVVDVYTGETLQQFDEKEVTLPSAADMAKFDTLVVDIDSRCPDANKPEFGNCGAWDYIADLSVYDSAGKAWEMARFITTYHRESRWVVDISPMLALLQEGGKKKLRWSFAPEWNKQPTATRLSLRFSNQGKGMRPTKATYLWSGGPFTSKYDDLHPAQDVPIPATAKKVELYALVTGHGSEAESCAEFCNHQHEITVGGTAFFKEFTAPEVAKQNGCVGEAGEGHAAEPGWNVVVRPRRLVPRAAGRAVARRRHEERQGRRDGEGVLQGTLQKATPPDAAGNIQLSSWLVVWE
ncbi:MAG: hypothetical protein IPJ34_11980 [Myxococcales bacterium]|nr:hypothetical protein [Myxococcales bacterium]